MASSRELANKFYEILDTKNFGDLEKIIHTDYVNHTIPIPGKGPELMSEIVKMFDSAFPDLKITVEGSMELANKTAAWGYWQGSHMGEFNGIPRTGKPLKVNYIEVWSEEDGKLRENWVQMDMVGMMQQMGVMPAK